MPLVDCQYSKPCFSSINAKKTVQGNHVAIQIDILTKPIVSRSFFHNQLHSMLHRPHSNCHNCCLQFSLCQLIKLWEKEMCSTIVSQQTANGRLHFNTKSSHQKKQKHPYQFFIVQYICIPLDKWQANIALHTNDKHLVSSLLLFPN